MRRLFLTLQLKQTLDIGHYTVSDSVARDVRVSKYVASGRSFLAARCTRTALRMAAKKKAQYL